MRKQKKQLAVLLTLAMVLQLAACSRAPAPSAPETSLSQRKLPGRRQKKLQRPARMGMPFLLRGRRYPALPLRQWSLMAR